MKTSIFQLIRDVWSDESGTVVIEYAMLATLVAMGILGAVQLTAVKVSDTFSSMANGFTN